MPAALSLSSSTAAVALTLLLSIIRSVSSVLIGDTDLQRFLQPNSNVTILNDGAVHTINEKFNGESFYVRNKTLILENGGEILATENWPGIRLVTSSTLNMTGGSVQGWHDKPAVELHNGQSNIDTASFAEIYGGSIVGGKSSDGVGGDAFYVHGFGTQAKIFAGQFIGGIGQDGVIDGLSIAVQSFASVHIHSGTFQGEMEVGTGSNIAFYGCFLQSGTTIAGEFVDGTELNVVVKTKNGGKNIAHCCFRTRMRNSTVNAADELSDYLTSTDASNQLWGKENTIAIVSYSINTAGDSFARAALVSNYNASINRNCAVRQASLFGRNYISNQQIT